MHNNNITSSTPATTITPTTTTSASTITINTPPLQQYNWRHIFICIISIVHVKSKSSFYYGNYIMFNVQAIWCTDCTLYNRGGDWMPHHLRNGINHIALKTLTTATTHPKHRHYRHLRRGMDCCKGFVLLNIFLENSSCSARGSI